MKKLFSLGALLMLAMCAGFICSCNDDVEETPPTTVTPPGGNATENKDTHEYVDLGLPSGTLWATCNVGASSPEEYGDYFAWGETEPKTTYDWSTYKYCKGSELSMTKYCIDSYFGKVDNKIELEPSDDVATANWGSGWQMPSEEQCRELDYSSYTTTTWTTMNGKYGRKITSKRNGNSIFLPAAGYRNGTSLSRAGSYGYYWSRAHYAWANSSGTYSGRSYDAYTLGFYSSDIYTYYYSRCDGQSVRPVRVNGVAAVSNIELSQTELFVKVGATSRLLATVLPADANKAVVWESSSADVATVDETGKVVAVAVGTCTITCSATDGSGVKAECQVEVVMNETHEYVDLGLPSGTLWATCNVGASKPEEYGDYFAWGETEPKSDYSWSTYKYCKGSYNTMTKYCTNSYYGTVDNKTELEPSDDAATANWGSGWQMPSEEQLRELYNSSYTTTTTTSTSYGWTEGYKITSKRNGNSIFLPAAGCRGGSSLYDAGSHGYYWSRSLYTSGDYYAYCSYFDSSYIDTFNSFRYDGQSVRPVRVKN